MKNTVSSINAKVKNNAKEFVVQCDSEYRQKLKDVVTAVISNDCIKIIMLAGPSGSGKTTTSHLLGEMFKESGVDTKIVSLDNFYLNRNQLPKDEDGMPDCETVYSLDLDEIDKCLSALINNGRCVAPIFDFHTGNRSDETLDITLGEHGLIIVEGLHALNPLLYGRLPQEAIFKLYISVASNVYKDDGTVLLNGQQMRFCRRMSRDSIYRNSTPQNTLKMWRDVIDGEKKWITPFISCADAVIDTYHAYENGLLCQRVIKMLKTLSVGLYDSIYADKIADALEKFIPIPLELIPQEALIREFVEGGKFEDAT